MYKNYIVYYRKIQQKKNPIKEHFASKLCPMISNGIKIAIQKNEQQNLKYPYAYQHAQTMEEERNKNNNNGKIIMMIDKREKEKKMHLHIHFFKESKRWYCIRTKNWLIV